MVYIRLTPGSILQEEGSGLWVVEGGTKSPRKQKSFPPTLHLRCKMHMRRIQWNHPRTNRINKLTWSSKIRFVNSPGFTTHGFGRLVFAFARTLLKKEPKCLSRQGHWPTSEDPSQDTTRMQQGKVHTGIRKAKTKNRSRKSFWARENVPNVFGTKK